MSWRNAWRFVNRVAGAVTVADSAIMRPEGPLLLFSCHDVDRAMCEDGQHFSPLLQGIREIVEPLGHAMLNLSHPYAVFRSARIRGGAITINRQAMAVRARLLRRVDDAVALRLELETRLYRQLLQRLQPALVFSIQPPLALCQAARQLGVRVVEAMHGTNISLGDRIFGAHMAQPDRLLPTIVLSFDDVSQATLSTLCAGRDIVALRANDPWLHSLRLRHGAGAAVPDDGVKRVLVTLQWGYDGERATLSNIIPNGVLHPAVEAAFAATAGRGVEFWLRLHPIQMNSPGYRHHRKTIEALAQRFAHVQFERASRVPLPLLLDEVCAHLTMSSSSVGEAAVAGVPSLMLCPTLRDGGAHAGLFRELERDGQVRFGTLDSAQIVAWIDACPARVERDRPAVDHAQHARDEGLLYSRLIEGAPALPATHGEAIPETAS
jgi:hypothetical protein